MSWAISTHNMECVNSYAAAVRIWDAAKPWKGEHSSWRQLDGRRMRHKRLVKQSDGGYACTLFRTAMVTYYPDRVLLDCYPSISTTAFCQCVRPTWAIPISHAGHLFWGVNDQFYVRGEEPLDFRFIDEKWTLVNQPYVFFEPIYQPEVAATLRKRLKPYTDWYKLANRHAGPFRAQMIYDDQIAHYLRSNDISDLSTFHHVATKIGSPKDLRRILYRIAGGYKEFPVPHHRLPRNTKLRIPS